MATRGFENWTEADVSAHKARIQSGRTETGQGATNGRLGVVGATGDYSSLLGHPDAITGVVKPYTGHKYRAEPCIVTPDLTLFTKPDIYRVEHAKYGGGIPFDLPNSLKARAARIGIVGEWFGSTKEGRRYIELRQLEKSNAIGNLRTQVPYELSVNGVRLGEWRADFVFDRYDIELGDTITIIEDVKGLKTPMYRLKKKIVEAQYGITIRET